MYMNQFKLNQQITSKLQYIYIYWIPSLIFINGRIQVFYILVSLLVNTVPQNHAYYQIIYIEPWHITYLQVHVHLQVLTFCQNSKYNIELKFNRR